MSVSTAMTYSDLVGKKVIVSTINPDTGEEFEKPGVLYSVAAQGILLIPKGKSAGDLIFNHEIRDIVLNEPDVGFRSKKIPPVAPGKMRQHLLDRHGYQVPRVEAVSEEEATSWHDAEHNGNTVLGHYHETGASGKK